MNSSIFNIPVYDISTTDIPTSRILGNNAKGMMVLVDESDFNAQQDLLKKILAAVSYDLSEDTVVILMNPGEKVALKDLDYSVSHLLLFGVKPSDAGLSVTNKRRLMRLEELTVVRAPALETVATNTDEKRKLWEILKSIFIA